MSNIAKNIMKKATTIEEQIKRLKERNVIFTDEQKAMENLLDIGYYRLGFYFFHLRFHILS
jgi:abortive infection bacteriophage resistance protein